MQSSSSVPVLILVLCCMASAHKAIHNRAIHHLKNRQDCLPANIPQRCADALMEFDDFNSTDPTTINPILDNFCSQICIEPLNAYYECLWGDNYANYANYLCLTQNNIYCVVNYLYYDICLDACNTCTDACRSCLDSLVNPLSCCVVQYYRFTFEDISDYENADVCGNNYTTCSISNSGGAIAVPTVLTALLLMVMAAIVV